MERKPLTIITKHSILDVAAVYIYIYIHNGFLKDCTITLSNKTDGADPTRREEYWRRVLKTVSPYGLNTVA